MPQSPSREPSVSPVTIGVVSGGVVGGVAGGIAGGGVGVPVGIMLGGMVGGAAGMGLSGSTENLSLAQKRLWLLQQAHIQVIAVGQDMMLVLPSSVFFYPDASHFNEGMIPTLDDIVAFMNQYDIETVKVAGYTNTQGSQTRNVALSRQQAQFIASQLWHRGLKSTMIYAIGYGSASPIADNCLRSGLLTNNRVQITFRRLTPAT